MSFVTIQGNAYGADTLVQKWSPGLWTLYDQYNADNSAGGNGYAVYQAPAGWPAMYVQFRNSGTSVDVYLYDTWDKASKTGTNGVFVVELVAYGGEWDIIENNNGLWVRTYDPVNSRAYLFALALYTPLSTDPQATAEAVVAFGVSSTSNSKSYVFRAPDGAHWGTGGIARLESSRSDVNMPDPGGGSFCMPLYVEGTAMRGTVNGAFQLLGNSIGISSILGFSLNGVPYKAFVTTNSGYYAGVRPSMMFAVAVD